MGVIARTPDGADVVVELRQMMDNIYCVLLLVCELGALALGWRTVHWLWLAAAQPVALIGLARLLHEDPFGATWLVAQPARR
jgi:hypothetical protein